MAISYPVDLSSRWTKLRVSTGELERNVQWPRKDGGEIQEADPDIVWLLQVRDTIPEYDPLVYSVQPSETIDQENNEIRISYSLVDAPVPEEVSALQGMLAINQTGLVSAFLTWKSGLDQVDDFEAIAFLDKAQTWRYDDPTLNAALVAIGVEAQKDSLFRLAASL